MSWHPLSHLGGLPLAVVMAACGEAPAEHALPGLAVEIFGDRRFFEPRLSPFENHEKCADGVDTSERGFACSPLGTLSRDVLVAERRWWREIEAGVARPEDSARGEALHAAGLRQLVWVRSGSGDSGKAIRDLRAAARAKPNSAAIFSDLAAGYLIHARVDPMPGASGS